MKLYKRWRKESVHEALEMRRVILLSGPRQCGKTTLSRSLDINNALYRTLDDTDLLNSAMEDPQGFVDHGNNLMIIDEIQKNPELLSAIKKDVDENQTYGRFLLTGSANIHSLPSVKESLAGRVKNIRLRTLGLGEIHGTPPFFLKHAFEEKFFPRIGGQSYKKNDYIELALRGGYPEVLRLDSLRAQQSWHRDYINALIERDLKDVINIRRKDSMYKLLGCLAAWSSKFMDLAQIGSGLSITRSTLESYVNALETLYLTERLRSWTKTDYDRVARKDKFFMSDTGLMSSILNWSLEKVQFNGDSNGKLIETFVFNQLSSIIDAQEENYEIYHYRDRLKREIDFLIQNEAGDYLGVEVKAGTNVNMKSFQHLQWFKENMLPSNNLIGIVLYTGEHVLPFGERMWAVPISALWADKKSSSKNLS